MPPRPASSNPTVQATFSAPLLFLSSDTWLQIRATFETQLPLKDLEWKPSTRPSARVIKALDVKYISFETVREEVASLTPQTLLDRPLLNIFVVSCEDNETYRNTVKKQIKDWHTLVSQRKSQEWLIVLVVRSDAKSTGGSFLKMKASVLDKIRSDFNTDKKERCVQLLWSSTPDLSAGWADVDAKVKEGIMTAFDNAITQKEEDVKRSESQRQMPGWNFCTFFILKETLATSFHGVGLVEDALLQYDELEAFFFQVVKEQNLSWFGKLIDPEPRDDSLPLLNISRKPYRDIIVANTISVFDFRIYLLAKQCDLLGKLGQLVQICKKVVNFLGVFGRRLEEARSTLPRFFIESWIYSSSLATVEQCEQWSVKIHMDGPSTAMFNAAKSELLDLALVQLNKIGLEKNYLPHQPPFARTTPGHQDSEVEDHQSASGSISQPELLRALTDQEAFYSIYISLTHRVIDLCAKGGRRKFAVKKHGDLALLELHRGRLTAAYDTFRSLPAHYSPYKWSALEACILLRQLETHSNLKKPKDQQWLTSALTLLALSPGKEVDRLVFEDPAFKKNFCEDLQREIQQSSETLDQELIFPNFSPFTIRLQNHSAHNINDMDGSTLTVIVHSSLPVAFQVTELILSLRGGDPSELYFSAQDVVLHPGENSILVSCPLPAHGSFLWILTRIRTHLLVLEYPQENSTEHLLASRRKPYKEPLISIPKNFLAFDVEIEQAEETQFGAEQYLLCTVHSGRNDLEEVQLQFSCRTGLAFQHPRASLLSDSNVASFVAEVDGIRVSNVPAGTRLSILVPYGDSPVAQILKIDVMSVYRCKLSPNVARSMVFKRDLDARMPLTINVQDHFRGKSLFCTFSIKSSLYQQVRFHSAKLRADSKQVNDLVIHAASMKEPTLLVPLPVNFVFKIDSAAPRRESTSVMLHIKYRSLREEVHALIKSRVSDHLSELELVGPSLQSKSRYLISSLIKRLAGDNSWFERYMETGALYVPVQSSSEETKEDIDLLKNIASVDVGCWRTMKISVPLPFMNITSTSRLDLDSQYISVPSSDITTRAPLLAGQPVTARFTIHTSFHWGMPDQGREDSSYNMIFDIEEMRTDWLISGRKKGEFAAKDGGIYSDLVTLIPLRYGDLRLPRIHVQPSPRPLAIEKGTRTPSSECYQKQGAERVFVLPRSGRSTFIVEMPDEEWPQQE
ncbi:hypothetical protein SISSUDRAFT_977081 [Sistotremastrum suecicum HHB10207 ss-3]|uniref:Trafficking protein particle complex subunit 10 n=1 Tax=Sistotremastrum suecicum HHB10207 ss-3 TaxID=1314776 RepID=A0A166ISP5_9AGAM|nr:hypothetical protein SISSUDRAFT_977081 [Sistotremastrum suecicum HHB10207 ss-3]